MSDERLGLSGRSVVVAGAGGGGIGTAVGRVLVEAGATVIAWDVDPARLAVSMRAMDDAGGEFRSEIVDVRDADDVDRAVSGRRSSSRSRPCRRWFAPPFSGRRCSRSLQRCSRRSCVST